MQESRAYSMKKRIDLSSVFVTLNCRMTKYRKGGQISLLFGLYPSLLWQVIQIHIGKDKWAISYCSCPKQLISGAYSLREKI